MKIGIKRQVFKRSFEIDFSNTGAQTIQTKTKPTTENDYSWILSFKLASTCTPKWYNSLKSLMPMSFNLLAKGGTHASIAKSSWSDSAGLYFIWANFSLHLVRKSAKGSSDSWVEFCSSRNKTSNCEFSPYCLMKKEHSSFQSHRTCASRV